MEEHAVGCLFVLVVYHVQINRLFPQAALLACANKPGNVHSALVLTTMIHQLRVVVCGIQHTQFGEEADVRPLALSACLLQTQRPPEMLQ